MSVTANFTSNQPLLSEVNLLAQLFVRDFRLNPSMQVRAGLYQHFNYFDSEPVIDGSDETPFKISEAAAFGPGFIFRVAVPDGESLITQQLSARLLRWGGVSPTTIAWATAITTWAADSASKATRSCAWEST